MGNFIYKRLHGGEPNPLNAKSCLKIPLFMLRCMGLWPPRTQNGIIQKLYFMYSITFRGFFMYLYAITQGLFLVNVEDLQSVSNALFLFLTQICLLYKLENYAIRFKRIKVLFDLIDSESMLPNGPEEERFIKQAMIRTSIGFIFYHGLACISISGLAIFPFIDADELQTPLPAWFPFPTNTPRNYIIIFVYQIFGVYMSACYNTSTDLISIGLMAYFNAQFLRLGEHIAAIGYSCESRSENSVNKKPLIDNKKLDGNKIHKEVIACVKFHKILLGCVSEIESIFRISYFIQTVCTVLTICMTAYQLVSIPVQSIKFFSTVFYFVCMSVQIFLPCWMGNEIIYSSSALPRKAILSNIAAFDRRSAGALIIFMLRCNKRVEVTAGFIMTITLSLENFLAILKTSYSYFALMQSMQE